MIEEYVLKDFGKILKRNAQSMRAQLLPTDTDAMRIYDQHQGDLPLTVDLYGAYARITDYREEPFSAEAEAAIIDVVGRMAYIDADKVIFHRREKRTGREQHEVVDTASLRIDIQENGLTFGVDLTKRVDTGLFLDHMPTRMLVESMSMQAQVLNLFSYTGSFSVYAARGGASAVDSIDLSATYTEWAEQNLAKNGFVGDTYRCIASDVYAFIETARTEKRLYDLIIFDPPTFSNSRQATHDFDVQQDYRTYLELLHPLLTKRGVVLFSTNLRGFRMHKKALVGYRTDEITKDVLAPGFTRKRASTRTWLLAKRDVPTAYSSRTPVVPQVQREKKKMDTKDQEQDQLLTLDWEEQALATEETTEAMEAPKPKQDIDQGGSEDRQSQRPRDQRDTQRPRYEDNRRGQRDARRRSDDNRRDRRDQRDDRRPRWEDDRRDRQDDRRPRWEDDRRDRRDDRRPRYQDDRRDQRDDRRPRWEDDRRDRRDDRRPRYQDDRRDDRRPRWEDDRRDRQDDRRPRYQDDRRDRQDDRRPRYQDDRRDRRDDRRPRYQDDRRDRRDDRRPRYQDDRRDRRDDRRPRYQDDRRDRRDDRRPRYQDDRRDQRDDRRPRYQDDRRDRRDDRRSRYQDDRRDRRDDRRPRYQDDRRDRRDDRRPRFEDTRGAERKSSGPRRPVQAPKPYGAKRDTASRRESEPETE
ncbi:MAG TPA: class I SAM-dependent methyltransferase [Sphaerochaeta sp.]|nr:class I SAM-dependent methyltransferase [Sphaerochaeta sp.]